MSSGDFPYLEGAKVHDCRGRPGLVDARACYRPPNSLRSLVSLHITSHPSCHDDPRNICAGFHSQSATTTRLPHGTDNTSPMASSSSSSFASGSTQRANSGTSVAPPPSSPQLLRGHVVVTETVTESRSGYGHKMLNQYELVRVLGTGQHGEVCYARNALTGVGVVRPRLP